jgi:hypothetical protein
MLIVTHDFTKFMELKKNEVKKMVVVVPLFSTSKTRE